MAENLARKIEEPEDKPDQTKQKSQQLNEKLLTATEVQGLKEGKVKMDELVQQREALKQEAETELTNLVKSQKVVDLKEYGDLRKELQETESPSKTRDLLDKIQGLAKQKEQTAAERNKELDPESPEIQKVLQRGYGIIDKNKKYIGTKQVDEFKKWLHDESHDEPTIAHLEQHIDELEGKKIRHKDGLAPRVEEYNRLSKVFKQYGLDPQDSPYIKVEGLSERTQFRKEAEAISDHFRQHVDTGFYSREMIQQTMRELLKTGKPAEIKRAHLEADEIATKESEAFTYLDGKMTVGGKTVRKMSEASKKKYFEYYKTTDIEERKKMVPNIKKIVEYEADLATELSKIYGDDTDGLHLALGSFEELDFVAKQRALKEHKNLVKNGEGKEANDKTLIVKAAHAKIDSAASQKTISQKTCERYKAFFKDPNNFKNESTRKTGDPAALKKAYEILISSSSDDKNKNLAAYGKHREQFQSKLKELSQINPNIDEKVIKDLQESYDDGGWSDREKITKIALPKELAKQKKERLKQREAGIDKSEASEAKEHSPERNELVLSLNELLAEDTQESISQGLKDVRLHMIANPEGDNDKVLLHLEEQFARRKRELGASSLDDKSRDKEMEDTMKDLAESDSHIHDHIEEEQIKTLNIQGADQSEELHDDKKSAHERAKDESLDRTDSGSIEENLTKDAYKQMGKEYKLSKEGTGEKMEEIKFNNEAMNSNQVSKLREKTRKTQDQLDKKTGFSHVSLKDKSGQEISAEQAETLQEQDLQHIEEDLAQKADEKLNRKKGTVSNLNDRVAARRKARDIIDKKRHEKLAA